MSPTFQRRLLSSVAINAADSRELLVAARALQRGEADYAHRLRGKNIALLCSHADCECARRFDEAASALGARVARIDPAPDWVRDEDAPIGADLARLIESLYDAVDCEEMAEGFAQRLQARLGVPVFDGLAREDHPINALLPQLVAGDRAPDDSDRRALLQATLLSALA